MTPKELSEIMERLERYYKSFYSGADKQQVFSAWYDMFRGDDAAEVKRAVIAYICTNTYAPTVAGIKGIMAENRMAGQMTEIEAWARIREAINKANGRYEAAEAFTALPPILQKLVYEPKRLREWRVCSDDTLEGVIASNVQRSYRELAKREAVWYAIPEQLQAEQSWRVDAPAHQPELPEPQKSISEIVEQANAHAAKHGMTMTAELQAKHADRVDAFLTPMTKDEKRIVEHREEKRGERFLK